MVVIKKDKGEKYSYSFSDGIPEFISVRNTPPLIYTMH